MNNCTIIGRLGADAEHKTTQGGMDLLSMRVAVNERVKRGDQWVDETTWFGVAVFGKRAQALAKLNLTKGTQVCCVGPVKARAYESRGEARASLDMIARDLHLLGGGKGDSGGQRQQRTESRSTAADDFPPDDFGDDALPF